MFIGDSFHQRPLHVERLLSCQLLHCIDHGPDELPIDLRQKDLTLDDHALTVPPGDRPLVMLPRRSGPLLDLPGVPSCLLALVRCL